MQRIRAQALWELGWRAEAVAELESVAARGTEELLPLHSLLACVAMCNHEDASLCADAPARRLRSHDNDIGSSFVANAQLGPHGEVALPSHWHRASVLSATPRLCRSGRWRCCARRAAAAHSSPP